MKAIGHWRSKLLGPCSSGIILSPKKLTALFLARFRMRLCTWKYEQERVDGEIWTYPPKISVAKFHKSGCYVVQT